MGWINIFNIIILILVLVPNVIYAHRNRNEVNKCTNRPMNIIEQIGRYGVMILMVFDIGAAKLGFCSVVSFVIWLISMVVLLVLYYIFYAVYSKRRSCKIALLLAVIPSMIFILDGILVGHWLLVIFGIIFSIAHVYVTYQNNSSKIS